MCRRSSSRRSPPPRPGRAAPGVRRRRRARGPVPRPPRHQVAGLVDEGVLVAEAVAGRPPALEVGVVGFGDQDPAEAGVGAGLGAVVILQLVEPLQVEGERAALAVELDAQGVLASGGVPGGLEGGEGAGGEPPGEQGGVVDGDLSGAGRRDGGQAAAGRGGQRPLPYERLGDRGDAREPFPGQVLRQVDDVRAEVAERTGAGLLAAQPPGQRELRVHQPVLQVRDPHVPQPPDPALRHHAPGQRGRGDPAVVEADHRQPAVRRRRLGGTGHRLGLLHGVGEGLLAQHVLARGERGERDLGVAVAGGADVDEVDVVPFDQGAPVGLGLRPAVPAGRRTHGVGVPATDHGQFGAQRQVEDAARGAPALGVGGAHEGVAHHADAQRWLPRRSPFGRLRLCHSDVLLVVVAGGGGPRPGGWSGPWGGAPHLKPVDMYWSTLSLSTTAE